MTVYAAVPIEQSPSETNAPNAVLKLSTSYEQDMAISGKLLNANQEKKEYNGDLLNVLF